MKTLKVQLLVAVVVLLVFFFAIRVHAQITPVGDSYTNSAAPTTNYGSKTLLDVDAASQITYIQFDLGSIPAGATVSQATLKLYVNSVTTAGSLNVDYVTASWSEGTIDSSNAPPLGATIASNVEVGASEKNHYLLINITPALVAWLNGSQTNDGIALVANGSFNATFDSKENTTTSHPPELDVVFAGGGGGTITGVLTGAGSGLVGGGTSGMLNLSLLNTCAANQGLQWNGSAWGCAAAGTGTVTSVGSGTGLTGGPITGSGTLSVDPTQVPFLAAANTFTASQTVRGNLSATGVVTGSGYQIGSNLFDYGSYSNKNAFLGFAGNATMTGKGNTASGFAALVSNTVGNSNTASGLAALSLNTSGIYNSAIGVEALYSNTTGGGNTASGAFALYSSITGDGNTASGDGALQSNTTGGGNTASGYEVLNTNSAGNFNAAQGYQALYFATGSNNTGLGTNAGNPTNFQPTTGSSNTYLGFQTSSGTQLALSNATAIGANAEVDASNAMVLGSINGVNGATASTNVGIGTTTPASTLDVHGTGNFTGLITFAPSQTFPGTGTITGVTGGTGLSGGGTSGNVTLTNTGILGLTAGTGISSTGGQNPTIAINTAVVPQLAGTNVFTGTNSFSQPLSGNLSSTGLVSGSSYQIGSNLFGYGDYPHFNAFLGFAGNGTTTGKGNTASGFQALFSNTSLGNFNTATGDVALYNNSTGINNTANGAVALYYNTSGTDNTAIGADALYLNQTGYDNTAIGNYSGVTGDGSYVTGTGNTFFGAFTTLSTGTLSNASAIGAGALVTESNAMILGSINGVNGATADTMVGIGSTAPTSLLHIGNSGGTSMKSYLRIEGPAALGSGIPAFSAGGYGTFGIDAYGTANGRLVVLECGAVWPCPQGNGLVSINTPSPDNTLTVNGSADKPGGGSWGTYSDGRLKSVDGNFDSGLDKILKLRPVRYRYESDNALGISDRDEHIGVVAQEVKQVLPEAVTENNKGYLLVNNDPIIWAMLNAIKEQQEIRAQRQEIGALRKQTEEIKVLRKQVAELQLRQLDLASMK